MSNFIDFTKIPKLNEIFTNKSITSAHSSVYKWKNMQNLQDAKSSKDSNSKKSFKSLISYQLKKPCLQ